MPCGIVLAAIMHGVCSRRHGCPVPQQPVQTETSDADAVPSCPAPGELYTVCQLLLPMLADADRRSLRATCKVGEQERGWHTSMSARTAMGSQWSCGPLQPQSGCCMS